MGFITVLCEYITYLPINSPEDDFLTGVHLCPQDGLSISLTPGFVCVACLPLDKFCLFISDSGAYTFEAYS